MPDRDPWTPGETTRALMRIEEGVVGLREDLGKKPGWEDISRLEKHRDAEQAKQDKAIEAVEADVKLLDDKQFRLLIAVVGAALTGASGLVIGLIP